MVDKEKVLNEDGLRNPKEFVNHKILDLAGDFLLSGFRILGKIDCYQGGHELSNMFLTKLIANKSIFEIFELKETFITKRLNSAHSSRIAVNA